MKLEYESPIYNTLCGLEEHKQGFTCHIMLTCMVWPCFDMQAQGN